jgi:WD40 repeat protein
MMKLNRFLWPSSPLGVMLILSITACATVTSLPAPAPDPLPKQEAPSSLEYPNLPGRLVFRSNGELGFLEDGHLQKVSLSTAAILPDPHSVAFSPDGRWLAVFHQQGDRRFLDALNLETWEWGRLQEVEGSPSFRWAPDGSGLAVVVGGADSFTRRIEYWDLKGNKSVKVAEHADLPTWLPDGNGLLYVVQIRPDHPVTELALWRAGGAEQILVSGATLAEADPEAAKLLHEGGKGGERPA